MDVSEIHSRKSQSQRNAAAEAFKVVKCGILFSSDVTARGMDFPGVTTVLQVGLPANAEQYIHRCVPFLGSVLEVGTEHSYCNSDLVEPLELELLAQALSFSHLSKISS